MNTLLSNGIIHLNIIAVHLKIGMHFVSFGRRKTADTNNILLILIVQNADLIVCSEKVCDN